MAIRRLPETVTHRIAAGEVIERPASVVKELLENALDAGASRVTVKIVQGGILSIVVEDDGTGIPPEELPLAVERFATSKLSEIDDLERITTLGFRGEALASIASVSRFEIRSRSASNSEGAFLRVEGGRAVGSGAIETAKGTRVQADDLFFNLPARRKFLKSPSAEQRRILKVVQEAAIVSPAVSFLFFADGKTVFRWEGGTRRDILQILLGKARLRETRYEKAAVSAEVWRGEDRPGQRTDILSFVNGRRVTEPTIRSALFALGPEIAGDWVVLIDCPPGDVDVNIHPAKAEVRFRNSGAIFEAVHGAAKALLALGAGIHFDRAPSVERTLRQSDGTALALPWPRVASSKGEESQVADEAVMPDSPAPLRESAEVLFLGSVSEGFLVFSEGNDLVIVDPHAAHERILYDRLRNALRDSFPSQRLGLKEKLSPSLAAGVEEHRFRLLEFGFRFEREAEDLPSLEAVPCFPGLESVSPEDLLRSTIAALDENSEEPLSVRLARRWAYAACHGAVKLTDRIGREEALALWQQLFQGQNPGTCPHGRPAFLRLEGSAIRRHFGRKD
jgi:DNA mismatch repair protein MutL